MSLRGWKGGRNCWHWIITLAERAILASMFRGLSVPRIVGSENRLSCMIYDVSRRGYDRSYPRNAKWRVRLPQVAIRQLKISRCSVSNRGRIERCIGAFRASPVFCRVWLVPRIDGFSRRIDARGCIELCVVVTIPFFREISPFSRLGFELGQIWQRDV